MALPSRGVLAHNVLLVEALRRCGEALQRRGIPVVALKGAALLGREYPALADRPMADVDVLVPAARWPEAVEIVGELGGTYIPFPHRKASRRVYHEHTARVPLGGVSVWVDIHRRFNSFPPFHVDYDEIIRRAEPHALPDLAAAGILRPAAEHQLNHLAIHRMASIYKYDPRNYEDAARVFRCCDVSPTALADVATRWGTRAPLYFFLERGKQHGFFAAVPDLDRFARAVAPGRAHRAAIRATLNARNDDAFRVALPLRARQLLLLWLHSPTLADAARDSARYATLRARDWWATPWRRSLPRGRRK